MTNPLGNKIYLIVGLLIILAVAVLAFFLFPNLTKEKDKTDTSTDSSEKVEIYGRVVSVDATEGKITMQVIGNETIYVVKVSKDLQITDISTGERLGIEGIQVGNTIKLILNSPPSSGSSGEGGSGGSSGSGGESNGDDGIIVIDDPDEIDVLPPDPNPNTIPKVK